MLRGAFRARSTRVGSLLVLLGVLLLALAGVIYVAQPAEAQYDWLHVTKAAQPEDGTRFQFEHTDGLYGPFSWSLASGESRGFAGEGPYRITEMVPAGWTLREIVCDADPQLWHVEGNTLVVDPYCGYPNGGNSDVSIGQTGCERPEYMACTFYNERLPGRVVVKKVVSPVDAPAATFGFEASWGPNFSLAGGGSYSSPLLGAGVYSVAEVLPLGEGWSLAAASCDDGSSPAAIKVSPGELVTCTFYNRYRDEGGSLTIVKRTTPAGGAGFLFDGTLGAFSLDDGGSQLFDGLAAGEYAVSETPPAGWEFEDVTCYTVPGAAVDYDVVGAGVLVRLAEGQDVTCKFANREEESGGPEGSLTIIKRTVPAGGEGFVFDAGALGTFSLDDGGLETFTDLAAGEYTVEETPAADWEFASVECEALDWVADGSSVTVNLAEGEVAVCTFTNGELPYTGSSAWLPVLLAGLATVLAGLGAWVLGLMRKAEA